MGVPTRTERTGRPSAQQTLTWTDPDSGLQVQCIGIEYRDFPVVEWTVYFRNTGSADTPILETHSGVGCGLAARWR